MPFDELMRADLLLHYLTFIRADTADYFWRQSVWFPRLTPYSEYNESIPVLKRLVSRRHFERAKVLFGVSAPNELKLMIERAVDGKSSYYENLSTLEYRIPQLGQAIPLSQLASVP
jgi:hypothetical protein